MKKILITGKSSYIGTSFEKWMREYNPEYLIDTLDMRDGSWEEVDFSSYDSVFHVAGIAHNSKDPKLKDLYYQVNKDLAIKVAKKAKKDNVSQFIFMSSMIVFGSGKTKITEASEPNPDNFYGDSKLQAEINLNKLKNEKFKIVIVRPPMIYGKGSKGNYPLLAKFARKTFLFPNYPNKRSMIHINNFCEFIRLMIINQESGVFHPQNSELVQTSVMVKEIAYYYDKKIWFTKIFNPFITLFLRVGIIKKVFGDLFYDQSMSVYNKADYQIIDFNESIKFTEKNN